MELQDTLGHSEPTAATAPATSQPATAHQRIRLWDLPVRLFHWSLVMAVSVAILTGLEGGDWMALHSQAGLVIVGLLAFRLAWGLLGSTYARFATFLPSPGAIVSYLQGNWRGVGHNPLGALSVLALIALLGAQVTTGLFGNDEIAFTGPLAGRVEEALSLKLTGLHHQLVNVLYAVLGLHVAAIVFYVCVKKDNLVKPMVTGWKDVDAHTEPPRQASVLAFVVALGVSFAAVYASSGLWIAPPVEVAPTPVSTSSSAPTATPAW